MTTELPTSTRRDQILTTAAKLFAERGFHGVSVHDIGAACGISGPALYKHFSGKDDVLSQALVAISEFLLAGGRRVAAEGSSPDVTYTELVEFHVDFALGSPELISVQAREWQNLAPDARRRVRELQLAYVDVWVDVLRELRPGLDRPAARAAAQAVFGLLNSTPHSARLDRASMRALLVRMARGSLQGL